MLFYLPGGEGLLALDHDSLLRWRHCARGHHLSNNLDTNILHQRIASRQYRC